MATRTFGASPGVRMSWSAKWSWKPETPGSEPAGARISAGKSGSVEMSLPRIAASDVNCDPVSCMPSPESPQKRTMTCESCSTGFELMRPCIAPCDTPGMGADPVPVVSIRGLRKSYGEVEAVAQAPDRNYGYGISPHARSVARCYTG